MDVTRNFGNTTTSQNKSSNAAIKAYLHTSIGDHKYVFDALCLFWEDQQRSVRQDTAQQRIKHRYAIKNRLFRDFLNFVRPYALLKVLGEKLKHLNKPIEAIPLPCNCTIEQSMGLQCFTI